MSKVSIKSERHGRATIEIDGVKQTTVCGVKLTMSVDEVNSLELEMVPELVEFEGEAQVIAVINGRKYHIIED